MFRNYKWFGTGVLALVVALIVWAWLPKMASSQTTQLAQGDVNLPLKVELKLAGLPDIGTPVELQATVKAAEDAPGTTAQIILPDGVRLVSGSLTWQGDLRANGSADFSATIVFDQYGEYEITASARSPIDAFNTRIGEGAVAVRLGAQGTVMGLATMNLGQPQLLVVPGGVTPMPEPDPSQYGVSPAPKSVQGCGSVRAYGWAYFRDSTNTNWIPATNVKVELWDSDSWSGDDYQGYAYADANGYWSIGPVSQDDEWWSCGLDLYNKFMYDGAWARVENSSSNVYAWQSGVASNVSDGTYNFGSAGIPYSLEEFRARNILFTARRAWQAVITRAGVPAEKATIQYRHNDNGNQTWPHYNFGGKVYLPGTGYDWSSYGTQKTVLHELGHHYQYELYGDWLPNPNCPSPHYVNGASSDNCGWLEGWATFVALYINNDANAYGYNYETLPVCSAGFPCAPNVEGRVTASLWDLYDSGDEANFDFYAAGAGLGGRSKIWDTVDNGGHQSTFWDFWVAYKNRYPKFNASRDPCYGVASIYQTGGIWFNYGPTMAYISDQSMVKNTTKYIDLWPYADDAECTDSSMTYVVDYASNPSVGATTSTASNGFLKLQPTANWTGWSLIRVWVGDGPTWGRVLAWAYRYVWVYVSNSAQDADGAQPPGDELQVLLAMQNGRPVPLTEASTGNSADFGRPAAPLEPTPTGMPIPINTPTPATGTPDPIQTPEPPPSTSEPTATPDGGVATNTPIPTSTPTLQPPNPTTTPGTQPTDLPTATPTSTPTPFPTSYPPTPTPNPPELSIDPSLVSLKQHQTYTFTAQNGVGPYTWNWSGGVMTSGQYLDYWLFQVDQSSVAVFEAGDQRGDFAITVSDSNGKQASAHVLVGGLEITTKPQGQPTHVRVGDTLAFQVDDVSAASRGPFLWILDGDKPTTSVGTIQAQSGGSEAVFTALGNGTALVTAYGTDPNGKVVNSNSILVIVGNTLEIPDVEGVPGSETTVRINFNNISIRPVSSFEMNLLFPSNLLTFKSVKPSFRAANFIVGSNLIKAGNLKIIMTSLTGETISPGQGPILDLRFDVASVVSGTASLNFEADSVLLSDNQVPPQDIPVQTKGGTFTVVSADSLVHDGDVNHDGKVNSRDLALAILIFLDRYAPSTVEFAAADISPLTTGDGAVDVTDALKIFNKALGKLITSARFQPRQQAGSIAVRMPAQITARAGEPLLLPIDLNNPSDAIGGTNLTLIYTMTTGTGTYTPTLDVANRAQNMRSDVNTGATGQVKVILYSPDTVQTIGAGNGKLATLNLGIVDQNVWVTVGVVGSKVSDVNGNALAHTVELYTPSTPDDNIRKVYLPIVVKAH